MRRRALRDGGRFVLCQRPDQLVEVLCALRAARLEPKRLAFVRQRTGSTPWLVFGRSPKRPQARPEAGTGYFDRIRRGAVRKINL